jgi:hypothetical protein
MGPKKVLIYFEPLDNKFRIFAAKNYNKSLVSEKSKTIFSVKIHKYVQL